MSSGMQNKIALITGGGTGIGAACARRFAKSGVKVALMGRRAEPIGRLAGTIGGIAVPGDVSSEKDCREAVRTVIDEWGGIDILVACAGIMTQGSATAMTLPDWNRTMDANLNGVLMIARYCIPAMQNRPQGAIVNVASLGSLFAPGEMAAYITSKTALIGLTRSMAVDFGPRIRVNALCPGWVLTPMSEEEMDHFAAGRSITRQEAIRHATRFLPLRRMADPDEIAACAWFLCSEDASFITGTTLIADGGSSAVDVGYVSLTE